MFRRCAALLPVAGGRVPGTGATERHALRPPRFQQVSIEEDRFEREQSERASACSSRDSCRECCYSCCKFFFSRKFYFSREPLFRNGNGVGWTFNCYAGDRKFD